MNQSSIKNSWELTAVSTNANGVKQNMWALARQLHKKRIDITFVQETKLHDREDIDKLAYIWRLTTDGEAYISPAAANSAGGVAILLSKVATNTLKDIQTVHVDAHSNRYLALSCRLDSNPLHLHCIYAPVERHDRATFFNALPRATTPALHIIAGDMNCIANATLDCLEQTSQASTGTGALLRWMTDLDVIDIWRSQHASQFEATSPSGRHRIDYILISPALATHAKSSILPRLSGADHKTPKVSVTSSPIPRGKGHWQCPLWLLPHLKAPIDHLLDNFISNPRESYAELFPHLIRAVTNTCRLKHKQVLRARKRQAEEAYRLWRSAHNLAVVNPTPARIEDALRRRELWEKATNTHKTTNQDAAFDKHFTEGECASKFFLRRPMARGARPPISAVMTPDGSTSHDLKDIIATHRAFWSKLYSSDSQGDESSPTPEDWHPLLASLKSSMQPNEALAMDAPLTTEEIRNTISTMATEKATGIDGIRAELLGLSVDKWTTVLTPVYEQSVHRDGRLPKTMRTAILILLHKKGDEQKPANFRPIALLTAFMKVMTRTYASRLQSYMPKLTPPAQTGFIRGRSITENILCLQDCLHWARRHCPEAIFLNLDFEKAYDRVQWPYLHDILAALGFGTRFKTFVKVLYSDRLAKVTVNGHLSTPFPITRGVMQGDPLSPLLFTIQALPLIFMIQEKRSSHAIPLSPSLSTSAITCYADDSTLLARSPKHAVDLYNVACQFCVGSGAKLHPDKSVAISASPDAPSTLTNGIKIAGANEPVRILGVLFGTEITRSQQTQDVMDTLLERCHLWSLNGRTLAGKAVIVQSILLATTWFVLSALSLSSAESNNMQRLMENFLRRSKTFEWNMRKKRSDLPRYWLFATKKQGGLGMTEVETILKVRKLALLRTAMKAAASSNPPEWYVVSQHLWMDATKQWHNKPEQIFHWHRPLRHAKHQPGEWSRLSPWWQSTIDLWLQMKWSPKPNSLHLTQLYDWPIWRNRMLKDLHGRTGFLHQAATSNNLQQTFQTARALGFLSFAQFVDNDTGEMKEIVAIEEAICDKFLETPVTGHEPDRRACRILGKHVHKLWNAARGRWVRTGQAETNNARGLTDLHWQRINDPQGRPFLRHKNSHFKQALVKVTQAQPPPPLLTVGQQPLQLDLNKERRWLTLVAPPGQDIVFKIIRRGLPLGYTRAAWAALPMVQCPICRNNVETYLHVFWECRYAQSIWRMLTQPWRVNGTRIQWVNAVSSAGVRLGQKRSEMTNKLWGLVRACILRRIWHERNQRAFNPEGKQHDWRERAAQAAADIRAHVRSAGRRLKGAERAELNQVIEWASATFPIFSLIMSGNIFPSTPRIDNIDNTGALQH